MIGRGPRSRLEAGLVEQRREMAQESA